MTIWTFNFLLLCAAITVRGEEISVTESIDPTWIIDQSIYPDSPNACAPTALLNALKFGDEPMQATFRKLLGQDNNSKLRYTIDRHFKGRPSVVAKARKRWGFHGVYVKDLAQSCNELLTEHQLETCSGEYLERRRGESDARHTKRVHKYMRRSIESGFPPILSLRSFVVRSRPENNHAPQFEQVFHHIVVVQSVPSELKEGAIGFQATLLDSLGGKLSPIYIHSETNQQAFTVLKGNEIEGEWLSGRPFLLAQAPKVTCLRPAKLKWSERYLVVVNFLIGRF